jgi:hypothetical protein
LGLVIELDEQVAAEHGLGDGLHFLAAQFLHLQQGQEAVEALVLQVFKGTGLLAGLGVDDVPSWVGCLGH